MIFQINFLIRIKNIFYIIPEIITILSRCGEMGSISSDMIDWIS